MRFITVGTRSKLRNIGVIDSLRLYGKTNSMVKQYNYLGVNLDFEMNLRPFYNHVRKDVYVKKYLHYLK